MKLTIIIFLSFFIMQKCDKKNEKIRNPPTNELSIKPIVLTQEELVRLGFGTNEMNCYKLEVMNNSNADLFIPCYKKSNGRVDYNPSRIRYFKNNEEGSQFAPNGIPNIFWVQVPIQKQVKVYSVFAYESQADSMQISFDYLHDTLNLLNVSSMSLGVKMPLNSK